MRTILCYGDSNTWGFTPGTGARYPYDVRWPGAMAQLLGPEYHVVEDGVNGRTTCRDEAGKPWRNGRDSLKYTLNAQKPIDLAIVMLGTNDLKTVDAAETAQGAAEVVHCLRHADGVYSYPYASPIFTGKPEILLVSPIHAMWEEDGADAGTAYWYRESRRFAGLYADVAAKLEVHFLDAAEFAAPGREDGVHLLPAGHAALARAMADKVRDIFGDAPPAL